MNGTTPCIFYARLPESLSEAAYREYLSRLPEDLQYKNGRLLKWQDKLLNLFGKLLTLEGLLQFGYVSDCLNRISYNKHQRPYISEEIDFNVSHAGDYVLCAIGSGIRMGIDIEQIKPVDFEDFSELMTDKQWEIITNDTDPTRAFFSYWTMKESIIKADGRGFGAPLHDIHIGDNFSTCDGNTWYLSPLDLFKGYCVCLATDVECDLVDIREIIF